jgi:hypothetical protein
LLLSGKRIVCILQQILSMRAIILTLAPVLFSATLNAQGVFSNKTQTVLEKVIQDYPNHFYNIKGELIAQTHEVARYRSTLQLPGSSSSTVTLYTATHTGGHNWTCTVFEAESFEQAKNRFRDIYGQIRNSIITTEEQKTYILSGQYEDPSEDRKLTRVIFSLLPGVGEEKKLKVELSLRHEGGEKWRISLSVSDQAEKEEIQGAITAN